MPTPFQNHINTKSTDTSIPDLSAALPPLTDECQIGFGPHRYMKLADVPVSFFEWMVTEQAHYPRVSRSQKWIRVMDWLRSKRKD